VRPEQLKDLMKGLDPEDVEIVSISARGRGEKIIARAEIRVGGEEPPDGRPVRYFRMRHSMATGWTVRSETQSWSYYLAF
jgi:hypothetical protein